eukprot:scaffold128168_cov69-Phaeocystis_antarctica.AAC.1
MCATVAPNFLPLRARAFASALGGGNLSRAMDASIFRACKICKGHKRLRRNEPGGLTCRAGSCKREYRDQRRTWTGDHTGTAT